MGCTALPEDKEIMAGVVITVLLGAFMMASLISALYFQDLVNVSCSEIDLEPPSIQFDPKENITLDPEDKLLNFAFVVSDEFYGGSRILDTRVLLYRTPEAGGPIQYWGNISEVDPKSKESYKIPVDLTKIHSEGLVDVLSTDGVGRELFLPEQPYVEGTITGFFNFQGHPIYTDCRYYMIIVAIDWLGNAYWEAYDITSYVHSLASGSSSKKLATTSLIMEPGNIRGKLWSGPLSRYYSFEGEYYLPYIVAGPYGYQKCFVMHVVPSKSRVEISTINVSISDCVYAGFMIPHCDELWNYRSITILVDGKPRYVIEFRVFIGRLVVDVLSCIICLPLMIIAIWYHDRRHRGRK